MTNPKHEAPTIAIKVDDWRKTLALLKASSEEITRLRAENERLKAFGVDVLDWIGHMEDVPREWEKIFHDEIQEILA